jgi:hypothetical protein
MKAEKKHLHFPIIQKSTLWAESKEETVFDFSKSSLVLGTAPSQAHV